MAIVSPQEKKWRWRIFLIVWLTYFSCYFCRVSLATILCAHRLCFGSVMVDCALLLFSHFLLLLMSSSPFDRTSNLLPSCWRVVFVLSGLLMHRAACIGALLAVPAVLSNDSILVDF